MYICMYYSYYYNYKLVVILAGTALICDICLHGRGTDYNEETE